MKHIKQLALGILFVFPVTIYADATGGDGLFGSGELTNYLISILEFINGVLIPFILGVAFLLFVWGMFQYFIAGGANEEAKEKGKSLLIYSIIGFVLIIVFWGVINLLAGATGLEGDSLDPGLIPNTPTEITG